MEKVYVTRPYMPPKDELFSYFSKIYENKILTNQGPLVCELEAELKRFLNVSYLHYVTNGTIALQLALKALDIDGGEIITTPFTYLPRFQAFCGNAVRLFLPTSKRIISRLTPKKSKG